jgi:hypothetical protein
VPTALALWPAGAVAVENARVPRWSRLSLGQCAAALSLSSGAAGLGDGRAGRIAWDETVYDGYIAAKRDRLTVPDDHQAVV